MAQLAVAALGATVGFMVGGPTGAQIGWSIGSYLGAETVKTEGPKLGDLTTTGSSPGAPIPFLIGTSRIAGQVIWASDKREIPNTQRAGKGGGGQEVTTYTYEVDIFIMLSNNEITGIRRIWANGNLIYTKSEESSIVSLISSDANVKWARATVYTGSPTQLPDPTYEAAVGAANACAYRGRGSVFIQGLFLGQSGIIPNLTFEVVADGNFSEYGWLRDTREAITFNWTPTYQSAYLPTGGPFGDPCIYSDALVSIGPYNANTAISDTSILNLGTEDFTIEGWAKDANTVSNFLYLRTINNQSLAKMSTLSIGYSNSFNQRVYTALIYIRNPITNSINYISLSSKAYNLADVGTWTHWVLQKHNNELKFIVNGEFLSGYHIDASFNTNSYPGSVVELIPGVSFDMGPTGPEQVYIGSNTLGAYIGGMKISNIARYPEVDDYERPTAPFTIDSETVTSFLYKNYDTLPKQTLSLSSVVAKLCDIAGIPTSRYDVSALTSITNPVHGIALSQVTEVRKILENLSETYFFEAYLSNKLYFIPKQGSSLITVPIIDIGMDGSTSSLDIVKLNDLEIPTETALTYSNYSKDYDQDTQYSYRISDSNSISTNTVNVPIVFTPELAKAISESMLYSKVSSNITAEIVVSTKYSKIVPTDVITVIDEYNYKYIFRVVKKEDLANSSIKLYLQSYLNNALIGTSITDTSYTTNTSVAEAPVSSLYILEIPLVQDSYKDKHGVLLIGSNPSSYSLGSIYFYGSTDNVAYNELGSASSSAVVGPCTTKLGEGIYTKEFDEFSEVYVKVNSGYLSSKTRSSLLEDPYSNLAIIGNELVQFRSAELVSDRTYRLSGFLRGLKGTEIHQGTHTIGDMFILLDYSGAFFHYLTTSDINKEKFYKSLNIRQYGSTALSKSITYTGLMAKPLSPKTAIANRDTSDTLITWYRRTRLSSNLVGGNMLSAPLDFPTEAYEIEIYSSNWSTVLRTVTSISTNSYTYTNANQVTDFGAAQSVLNLKIYQVSPTVGRGTPLTITL